MKFFFPLLIAIGLLPKAYSQANFSVPDTVCVNRPVAITNLSPASNSYYWNFCLANTNNTPEGVNMGNIGGIFDGAVYMDYVQVNGNFYGFVTDNHAAKLYRLNFGASLLNTPTITDLGNVGGIIPLHTEGIQVVQNEGKWYAVIVGGDPAAGTTSKIVKIEFGVDIANNAPVGTNWGNLGNLSYPHDLYLFKEGANWYGVTVNYNNNSITRFDFTSSFSNTPTGTNLGNVGNLSGPTGVCAIKENGNWFVFITNAISSTLSRLSFGSSLLSSPTAVNLGNIGGTFHTAWDIDIIRYCGNYVGFVINADQSYGDLIKLDFNNNLTNAPTAISFGNPANLKFPHCLSRIFRWESDLYTFIPNVDNHTLARLKFPGCNSTSIPNSNQQNPLPVSYNAPGTYNINLTIDDGLPTQSSFCRNVVVMPELQHTPIQNLSFCTGGSVLLKSNFSARNTWSTGSTANSINISSAGTYWVETTNGACTNRDSFNVTVAPAPFNVDLGNDTSICTSQSITLNAGNTGFKYFWNTGSTSQTISIKDAGVYSVVVGTDLTTCVARDSIKITVLPKPVVSITPDTVVCKNSFVQLTGEGGVTYSWSPTTTLNNGFIQNPVASPLTSTVYYLTIIDENTCSNTDSVKVEIASDNNFILNSDYNLCYGDSIELKATGGNKYSWTPNASLTNTDVSNPIVFPQTTSTYSVLVTDNCNNSATLSTTVTVLPAPAIQVVKSNDVDCNIPRSQLQAMGAKKYIWSPTVNITDATISNPIVYPKANTWYTVIGTDENGCRGSDSVLVSSSISAGGANLYIPNAFTPNADLKNDCFGMKHLGEVDFFKLSIYSRWGQLLFQTNNANNCWDGTFQGRQQPAGVYIYLLSIKSICIPQLVKKEGVVTLIR